MATNNQIVDVGPLIEEQKMTWFRVQLVLWACAIMAIEGYDMQVVAYAAPSIIKAWHANKSHFGQVFGIGLVGYMLGATLLAQWGDRIGRKKMILAGLLLFGAFTFASGYATTISSLIVIRFIAGIGLGASIPTTIALAAEYSPSRTRATTVGWMFIGYNVGAAVGGVIAARYIPMYGWPVVFFIGGILPIALAAILVFALPESVRFLAFKRDRPERIRALLARLAPERSFDADARFVLREESHSGLAVKYLFTDGRAMMTTLLWIAFAASLIGHYFLTSWLPTVLAGTGVPLAHAVMAGAMFQLGGGFGSVLVCRILDKRGIVAIAASFAIATPLTILIGAVAGMSNFLLMSVVLLSGFFILGGQVGLNAVSGSVYPTYIRSTGAGWAFGVGRIGSIVGPVLGGFLITMLPTSSLFVCASVPMLCCAGAAYLLAKAPAAERVREVRTTVA